MKRPLAIVASLYVAGLLLARYVPTPLPLSGLFALSIGAGLLALCWPRARLALLWPLVVLTGWTNLAARLAIVSPSDLRTIVGEKTELALLRGTLVETPNQRVYVRDEQESWRTLAVIEVERICRREEWTSAFGQVAITTPGVLSKEFFAGQTVTVSGVLRPPKGPAAEGLFDYRTYLRWKGIHYQLNCTATNDWQLVPAQSLKAPPMADRFREWAQRVLARGLPVEDESLRLLWAMTLGWQTALTSEVSEPFMRSGTMHIFAISGLHIALIAGIFVALLRVLQVPRGACGVIVIPLIWFYTAATGWQPSAIRSTIMMTVIILGWSLERPSDLLNSLAAAGLIILLWQPEQLFQASFQLSFFVVLSIALLMPTFERLRQRLLRKDPFLPDELRPRWQRWLDLPIRFVTTSFATSLAAWLGSMPLIAYYFHLFTPGSLIANLLVVPVSGFALACNLASLVCGDWLPWATELFNHSGWFWMWLMERLSQWATKLPGAYFYVQSPTPLEFVLYYTVVFALVSGWLWKERVRVWTGAVISVLVVAWFRSWRADANETRITVLGGAQAVFVDPPGRANDLLIDAGNESSASLVVKPFLHGQGANSLPSLLLTHGDLRHVGGTELLREQFLIREVVTSPVKERSPAYRSLLIKLAKTPEQWRKIQRADSLAGFAVLHPQAEDSFAQADDSTVVLRGTVHSVELLFLSELGRLGQRVLLEREKDLRADLVIAGLPTLGEPLNDALLDAIAPRVVLIADSEFPAHRRASRALRERLAQRGMRVIYASDAGSLTVSLHRGRWRISDASGAKLFESVARSAVK
jgi:ComEC/Rec2-related protein